ncbi:MAG: sulfotransferase family protein [Nitriliruptorales bacterium]|nr:sulfotransferase family protein [Nitriliruptorales bacterium]
MTDTSSEKVISHTHRFLWVGVPKAATRSLITVLLRKPPIDLGGTEDRRPLGALLDEDPARRDFYIFTFVRNPWARAVSVWKDKVINVNEDKAKAILRPFKGLEPGMPFEAFVEFLVNDPGGQDNKANPHWVSQHHFLRDSDGELAADFVGRVENIAEDFAVVAERIGLPATNLPVLNTRFGWRPDKPHRDEVASQTEYYREYYTPKLRDAIAERYAEDVELFEYSF